MFRKRYSIYLCKKYSKYRKEATLLYSKEIKLNEDECFKINIRKITLPYANIVFSIEAILENKGNRSLEEILLFYQRENEYKELPRNTIVRYICNDKKTIRYEDSVFFSILDLGEYRKKSVLRNLYNILTNFDGNYKKVELFLSDIFKDNWGGYIRSIKVQI
ncbi:MAG: hypothetical protein QXG71_02770 [Nanopusillaceae archaeon]